MDITKGLNVAMVLHGIKKKDVATALNVAQNQFQNTLKRNDYKVLQLVQIADIIGYDVKIQLVDRESGKVIDIE